MNNWISLKSGQPPKNKWCLVYRPEFCEIFVARYLSEDNLWYDNKGWVYGESAITHWMPLPKPPEGE